ncbi:MAG: hypothetical protein GX431_03990 [Bacteroidales bacterium]|jgi:hypothetical protein|nr:hypothetical protein [Bacteroidales bacterium]
MKKPGSFIFLLILLPLVLNAGKTGIDRHALVTRHNIEWNDVNGQIPLGNGEFCFNADGTGLQTFGGNTMSHWGWHSFPLPPGITSDQIPSTGTFQKGRITGPDIFPQGTSAIRSWMFDNPHVFNLGRIRLTKSGGVQLDSGEIKNLKRKMDLWSGIHSSEFYVDDKLVKVITCVHPAMDMVTFRIESELLENGNLEIVVDFPYPDLQRGKPWSGNFEQVNGHRTVLLNSPGNRYRADFLHEIDSFKYYSTLVCNGDGKLAVPDDSQSNAFRILSGGASSIEFICAFSDSPLPAKLDDFRLTFKKCTRNWQDFWKSGGAIDLSGSTDPRWKELERRIVLSQYLLAVQSAGSFPPSEAGLMEVDPWRGQFHMEMTWWHLAHYGLWNRWSMAEDAIDCYRKFIPSAGELSRQLGYKGLKWPKSVGPEGRSAPWAGNQVLLWKQPHPIFFAELEYRLRPGPVTLKKWSDIIEGTATHMADYAIYDAGAGVYHLDPVMPPSEQGITRDAVFDLAYWRWGLDHAQIWRKRMNKAPDPFWHKVRKNLAPLPVDSGVYVHSSEWHDTYIKRAWEHPDPVGVIGMLPPVEGVDRETAHRTLLKIWQTWDWKRCWGWDFPWFAIAAARLGEPKLAVDALLKDAGTKNFYDTRGVCTGGPCPYLPGNGGLLYAVAMMAAGWDGAPDRQAPGFPDDGTWTVRWEGLKPAL